MTGEYGFKFDTTYTKLPQPFFARNAPAQVKSPQVVIMNHALSEQIGIDLSQATHQQLADLFSGNVLPQGATAFSQAYAGHQFGHFTMLGDGRAHMMGEHLTPSGQRLDIQYKGAGRTPYSRRGDGRAALGPMLREYIISEALHHLGIPSTRSLAVVTTGDFIMREKSLPGAVLTRVASSHIRVGTFEYAANPNDVKPLEALLDYTIDRHYPELAGAENKALALLGAVMERQVSLIVHWMRVGFVHGVMNTDNVTLSGEAIDFGPCAFIDTYDPKMVFSSIDQNGRYAFGHQAQITHWNLARLAEALLPIISSHPDQAVKKAEDVLQKFPQMYQRQWLSMMRNKLGLLGEEEGDGELINQLLDWMYETKADYTMTFHALSQREFLKETSSHSQQFASWLQLWNARRNALNLGESEELMATTNPVIIPRNYQVEHALTSAETGGLEPLHNLLNELKTPYQNGESKKIYKKPPAPSHERYQTFCGT